MLKTNVLDLDEVRYVWRVFKPTHLVSDIEKRRLTLVRPSCWDDPFENFLEKCKFKLRSGEMVDARPVLTRFFGQCWTTTAVETDATWRIYSPDKNGVRVRSLFVPLANSMGDKEDAHAALKFFAGRVRYLPVEAIDSILRHAATAMLTGNGGRNLVDTLLMKRREFEHEQEARLIFYDANDSFTGKQLWSFPIEPNEIFEEATFDPRMSEADVAEWTQKLNAAGFRGEVSQSTLYQPPSWEITLTD